MKVQMSAVMRGAQVNRLLALLPRTALRRLLAQCDAVELTNGEVLYRPDVRIQHVYFPTGSFLSLSIPFDGSAQFEIGLVGNEGMLGLSVVVGLRVSNMRALVQGSGSAWRIGVPSFVREMGSTPALRHTLNHYLEARMGQLARTAACIRFHVVEQRLARRLLMTHDRAHADLLRVTHKRLADVLGVRRSGITNAANALQSRHLIHCDRGEITIVDRKGMEAASCGCYQADLDSYNGLLALSVQ